MDRLKDRVALVTGAGSGIGKACARLFASEGALVAVSDIRVAEAEQVAREIRRMGGRAEPIPGDVADKAECGRIVAETVSSLGALDILVNSAGVTARYAPDDWDFEKKWDFVMTVNLKGSMMMSWFAVEWMKSRERGAIVNLASIVGLVGYPEGLSDGFNAYPPSKGGVVQMTRDMAVALAKTGIRVNALCPGYTYTEMTRPITELPEQRALLESLHPMGRLAHPDEIARAALFLACDDASFITGACLPVDGGFTAQ